MTGSPVTYRDPAPAGLARLLGDLIEQNLTRDPSRRHFLRPAVVVVASTDDRVAVTLRFTEGAVRLEHGVDRGAEVVVAASSRDLFELVAAPLRFGLPDLLAPRGRALVVRILLGRIRIRGIVRRLPAVRRLTMLLTAT